MNFLITTDLHLTANPRDEYRWRLFPWLEELLNKIPHSVRDLFILGDITDAKDGHNSLLVNRIVDTLVHLYRVSGLTTIWILLGNHDGIDPNCPYFRFLSHFPYIRFIHKPTEVELGNRDYLLLPHSRNPEEDWKGLNFKFYNFILMHNTVTGAVAESGQPLNGVHRAWFHAVQGKVLSGDVHVPQTVGNVEYVGAPYHVHFGDLFEPRIVVYLDNIRQPDPHPKNLSRHTVTVRSAEELRKLQCAPGDQIKVRLALSKSEYTDWQKRKREIQSVCKDLQLELCAVELARSSRQPLVRAQQLIPPSSSPQEALKRFCTREKIDGPLQEVGEFLL